MLKPNAPYEEVLKAATEEMQKLYAVRHPFVVDALGYWIDKLQSFAFVDSEPNL